MSDITARFFDGLSARPWAVTVTVHDDTLSINASDLSPTQWPIASLSRIPTTTRDLILTSSVAPQARLHLGDHASLERLEAHVGHVIGVDKPSHGNPWTIAAWLASAAAGAAFLLALMPVIADGVAPYVPESWRMKLGEIAITGVVGGNRSCMKPDGRAALKAVVRHAAAIDPRLAHVKITVVRSSMINAVAVPGNDIIIFSELIDAAQSPDEVVGVLAHEFGHLLKDHPTAAVIRTLGLSYVVQVLLGGVDNGSISAIFLQLYGLKYSRKAEAEADALAADLMRRMDIDPAALAVFFARVQSKNPGLDGPVVTYLSSHPDLNLRQAFMKDAEKPANPAPALSAEDWAALKAICSDVPKAKSEQQPDDDWDDDDEDEMESQPEGKSI